MALHILKLCVGADTVEDLANWQASGRPAWPGPDRAEAVAHITRMTPKRQDELLDGGSLYWVVRGQVCVRQRLLALEPTLRGGVPHCALVLDPVLILTRARPHRPFQGWRYLKAEDAPPDVGPFAGAGEGSASLRQELMELGLI